MTTTYTLENKSGTCSELTAEEFTEIEKLMVEDFQSAVDLPDGLEFAHLEDGCKVYRDTRD